MDKQQQEEDMVRGSRTILVSANDKSYSLRSTVPKAICQQFELKEKDELIWEIRPNPERDGLIIVITPDPAKEGLSLKKTNRGKR